MEEEKKDVEKPAEAPKALAKAKPKKALAERIEEREVCLDYFSRSLTRCHTIVIHPSGK